MDDRPITQHDIEIQQNRLSWGKKPLLRKIYADFYTTIRNEIREDSTGSVVELGSGIGNFKSVYPKAIATDLFQNPWIDRVESAYALSFPDTSVSHLILFDVLHHLAHPGTAFEEFKRVVPQNGRVIIFEPYISLFGFLVYGLLHHEPVAWFKKITWSAPDTSQNDKAYYAAQGNATRIFHHHSSYRKAIESNWRVVRIQRFSALSYILSGGFSKPAMYPESLLPLIKRVEKVLDLFPLLFATRILIVLERK